MDYYDVLNKPNIENLNIEHVCRICLQSKDKLYLIFDEKYVNNGIHLPQMIKECASCDVIRYDNYPHKICKKCLDNVYIAHNFRKQCQNSHILIKLFLGNKTDAENNVVNVSENALEKSTQTQSYLYYPCEKCDERFWSFDELSGHNFYKHRGTPNACKICKQVFKRPGYLRHHLSSKHPETGVKSRNQCEICSKIFSQAGHLQRHLIQVHKCDDAQKYMENRFELKMKTKDETGDDIELKNNHKENFHEAESLTAVEYKPRLSSDFLNEMNELEPDNNWNENDTRISTEDEDSFPLVHFKNKNQNDEEVIKEQHISLKRKTDLTEEFNDKMIDSEEKILSKKCKASQLYNRKSSRIKVVDRLLLKDVNNEYPNNIQDNKHENSDIKKNNRKKPKSKLKCGQCDKKFLHAGYLKKHEDTHLETKIHNCSICSRPFPTAEDLKLHQKNVHKYDRTCKKCSKIFAKNWHLRLHTKTCIVVKDNKFKCFLENCTEVFNNVRNLNVHIKNHHPSEKQIWVCRYCQEKFRSKGEIQKHSKIHDDEKPHLCNECGKKFSDESYLKLHILRHKGEKTLKCKYCERRFIRTSDLQLHEMYHTGVKPYICETCGKGFIRASKLRIHYRTHTGEKPYKCSYCDRSFVQKQDMTAHEKRVHTGERYNCPMCSEGYVFLYKLTKHKKLVHGIDEPSHIQRLAKVNLNIS